MTAILKTTVAPTPVSESTTTPGPPAPHRPASR